MSRDFIPMTEFGRWLRATFADEDPIRVEGRVNDDEMTAVPVVEMEDVCALRVRVLVPQEPPVAPGASSRMPFRSGSSQEWWNAWSPILVASLLAPPLVDPVRLAELLHERRRLQFFCDTNALAAGSLAWLIAILDGQFDVTTSAVVDREIAAWVDHDRSKMWEPQDIGLWQKRTRLRMARRVLETAPVGMVIDRVSAEQGALMLAKVRDEDPTERKSPDADMLLLEMARRRFLEQPLRARLSYLTGDRNSARTAAVALGDAGRVFLAAPDPEVARRMSDRVVCRGWWRPGGPFGSFLVPPAEQLLIHLLDAFHALRLKSAKAGTWELTRLLARDRGVPSDWSDPWFSLERVSVPPAYEPPPPLNRQAEEITAVLRRPVPPPPRPPGPHRHRRPLKFGVDAASSRSDADENWLLCPRSSGDPVALAPSLKPSRIAFFDLLKAIIVDGVNRVPLEDSGPGEQDAASILFGLGALGPLGGSGDRVDHFRTLWFSNDLDGLHAELLRTPGYRETMNHLREAPDTDRGRAHRAHASLARALGQAARLTRVGGGIEVGDAPIGLQELVGALRRWLPGPGSTASTSKLCTLALDELRLTPARFERAMIAMWKREETSPFTGETGGQVEPGFAEKVVRLKPDGYEWEDVAPGALSFGSRGVVRFVKRIS